MKDVKRRVAGGLVWHAGLRWKKRRAQTPQPGRNVFSKATRHRHYRCRCALSKTGERSAGVPINYPPAEKNFTSYYDFTTVTAVSSVDRVKLPMATVLWRVIIKKSSPSLFPPCFTPALLLCCMTKRQLILIIGAPTVIPHSGRPLFP